MCLNENKNILFIGTSKKLKIIDINDENDIFGLKIKSKNHIKCIDANSKNVFFTNKDDIIRIWDFSYMRVKGKLKGHTGRYFYGISCAVTTKDGKYLISAGYNGSIKVWNLFDYRELVELRYGNCEITAVNATSDNKFIISGNVNGAMMMWSLLSMSLLCYIKLHSFLIKEIKVSAEDFYAGIGREDGVVHLWNINTREIMAKYSNEQSVNSIAFDRACRHIIVACGLFIKVWKIVDY